MSSGVVPATQSEPRTPTPGVDLDASSSEDGGGFRLAMTQRVPTDDADWGLSGDGVRGRGEESAGDTATASGDASEWQAAVERVREADPLQEARLAQARAFAALRR